MTDRAVVALDADDRTMSAYSDMGILDRSAPVVNPMSGSGLMREAAGTIKTFPEMNPERGFAQNLQLVGQLREIFHVAGDWLYMAFCNAPQITNVAFIQFRKNALPVTGWLPLVRYATVTELIGKPISPFVGPDTVYSSGPGTIQYSDMQQLPKYEISFDSFEVATNATGWSFAAYYGSGSGRVML